MGLFRPYSASKSPRTDDTRAPDPEVEATAETAETPPASRTKITVKSGATPGAPRKKSAPTPTRKQAELARKQALHPNLTGKQRRRAEAEASRKQRVDAWEAQENSPERRLLRDHVDHRFHPLEFALPVMVVFLAGSYVVQNMWPQSTYAMTAIMYSFLLWCIFDVWLTWRGFKRLLEDRHPRASRRGLFMYMLNRLTMIRGLRRPAPAIKRGQSY